MTLLHFQISESAFIHQGLEITSAMQIKGRPAPQGRPSSFLKSGLRTIGVSAVAGQES